MCGTQSTCDSGVACGDTAHVSISNAVIISWDILALRFMASLRVEEKRSMRCELDTNATVGDIMERVA